MIISLLFAYLQGYVLLCTIFRAEFVMNYVAAAFQWLQKGQGELIFSLSRLRLFCSDFEIEPALLGAD